MTGCFRLDSRKNLQGAEYYRRETKTGNQLPLVFPFLSFWDVKGLHCSRTNGYEYISKWTSQPPPKERENLKEERRFCDGGRSIPTFLGCPLGGHLIHCTCEGGPSDSSQWRENLVWLGFQSKTQHELAVGPDFYGPRPSHVLMRYLLILWNNSYGLSKCEMFYA